MGSLFFGGGEEKCLLAAPINAQEQKRFLSVFSLGRSGSSFQFGCEIVSYNKGGCQRCFALVTGALGRAERIRRATRKRKGKNSRS